MPATSAPPNSRLPHRPIDRLINSLAVWIVHVVAFFPLAFLLGSLEINRLTIAALAFLVYPLCCVLLVVRLRHFLQVGTFGVWVLSTWFVLFSAFSFAILDPYGDPYI